MGQMRDNRFGSETESRAGGGKEQSSALGRASSSSQATPQVRSEERGGVGRYGSYGAAQTPFSFVRRMMDDMDRLFGGVIDTPSIYSGVWSPPLEVVERDGNLVVRADLPGIAREDVRVSVEEGALVIEGERRTQQEEERDGYYHSERSYGSFQRTVALPRGVDRSTCDASFDNGVLEITMKMPKTEARSVQIRAGSTQKGEQVTQPAQGQSQKPQNGPPTR